MRIINNADCKTLKQLVKRPSLDKPTLINTIESIYQSVINDGDDALRYFSKHFDKIELNELVVKESEIEEAFLSLSMDLKEAILIAKTNIEIFHKAQCMQDIEIATMQGVTCRQVRKPIQKVGLYIPGGTAPLFSTLLMLALPAKIAGCKEIVVCSPPSYNGGVHPTILAVAKICGIDKIIKIGGAQAVAAMAVGTNTVPKVDKIFGPGNQYVTAAKEYAVNFNTAFDMPSGPSEVLIFADHTCIPAFVASDLLSQAEHGIDSQAICVTCSFELAEAISNQVDVLVKDLERKEVALQALNNSFILVDDSINRSFEFINEYAPEHLIIASNEYEKYIDLIENAGSVFLGNFTPEAAGDYASGTNHALPTSAWAKSYSGVCVDSFMKKISMQHIDLQGIANLGDAIIKMAEAENLSAHAKAVEIRLKTVNSGI
jgi:histidinol dehydrogenase